MTTAKIRLDLEVKEWIQGWGDKENRWIWIDTGGCNHRSTRVDRVTDL